MKATKEMISAGAEAARKYMKETGGNSPAVIWDAMWAAQPKEPEQEPVAWMQDTTCGLYVVDHPDEWHCIPLYTTPPQRKPLTDEQRNWIVATCPTPRHIIKAVEAAHGIKE